MPTNVLAPESVTVASVRRGTVRNPFFAVMAAVTLFLVVSGFTPTLYLRPLFNPPAIPGYLFIHGIVLTSWFVLLFVQTLLVQSRRTALHRRLGVAGAVLAVAVPFAGLLATSGVVARVVSRGIDLDADASALGIGVSGPVVRFLAEVVWGNVAGAVSFAVLAWTGLLLRRRVAVHKRLMLLATIAVIGPALARLARLQIFGGEQGLFTMIVLLTLTVAVIVHDVATIRKVHPATVLGASFAIGMGVVCRMIASSEPGLRLVDWLQ